MIIIVFFFQEKIEEKIAYINLDLLIRFFNLFKRNFKLVLNFLRIRFILFWVFIKDTTKKLYTFIFAIYDNIKLKNYK